MESDLRLGPFQIIILLLLFLASCDSQQTSEEESDLEGFGTAGIEITAPFSSSSTSEQGGTVSSKFRLKSAPLSPVTITLNSSDTQEGTVSPTVLTFNKDNWDSYVSIIVTGVDDDIADGSQLGDSFRECFMASEPNSRRPLVNVHSTRSHSETR